MVYVEVYKEDGKVVKVPIDPRPPIYRFTSYDGEGTPIVAVRDKDCGVSHFATCPKASVFSGGKKKP